MRSTVFLDTSSIASRILCVLDSAIAVNASIVSVKRIASLYNGLVFMYVLPAVPRSTIRIVPAVRVKNCPISLAWVKPVLAGLTLC